MITKDFNIDTYIDNVNDVPFLYRRFGYGDALTTSETDFDKYKAFPRLWMKSEMLNF
jgi:hypothetical protein